MHRGKTHRGRRAPASQMQPHGEYVTGGEGGRVCAAWHRAVAPQRQLGSAVAASRQWPCAQ
eukprot:3155382-Prymnesium_polylepis.1